jgi:poly(3-hydroxybutyrate) depolymerase
MLYELYETQRALMEPFSDLANFAAKSLSNPVSPLAQSTLSQRMAAGYELMHRLAKDYEKPEFGLRTVDVDGVEVAIHQRVEWSRPFCDLLRFKRLTDDSDTLIKIKDQPVVLIVAPLSGHYATLLRDTVKTMLKDHKVYITDWKNARLVPLEEGAFHLDDYVNYIQEFIRHVQSIYGNCHVVSVCQPTVPVLAAISLMASRGEKTPLTMTMMGGPIDARKSPTAVNNLATTKGFDWFENNVIYSVPGNFPGAGRRVYPGFLQHTGFVAMNPDRHTNSHFDYFKNLIKGDEASLEAHRKFYDEYNAVLDMDADYYLETIRTVFQDFNLVYGTWHVKGVDGRTELVRPQDITTTAMLTVEGELDDISGSGQTAAAHGLCTGISEKNRQHLEVPGAGHYGIFSGRRWREVVYPEVRQFILNHAASAAKTTPQAIVAAPSVQAVTKRVAVKKAAPAAVTAPLVAVKAPVPPAVVAKAATVAVVEKAATKAVTKAAPKAAPKAAKEVSSKVNAKPVTKQAAAKASVKATTKPASKVTVKAPSVKTAWVAAPQSKA